MGVSTERTARLASTHHARFVSRGRELLFSCHTLSPSKSDHQLGYPKLNALPSPGGRRVFLLAISTLAGGGARTNRGSARALSEDMNNTMADGNPTTRRRMVSLSQAGRAADGRAMRGRAAPLGPKARARRPAPGPSGGRLVAREAGPARKSVNATHSLSSALAGRIEWDREGVLGSGATGTSGSPAAAALIFEEEVRQSRNETTSRFEEEDAAAKQTVNRLITEAPDAYALCAVAKTHWRSFDATATTRAIAWLAKFSTIKDDREVVIDAEEETHRESLNAIAGDAVKRLRALVGKHAMEFSARDVVVLLGGFAQLGWDLVPALSDRVRVLVESGSGGLHLSKLSAQEIVCAVWALGSCAGGHGGRGARPSPSSFLSRKGLRRLEDTCLTHLTSGSLEAAQMVQIVWGFGQLNHKLAGQAWYGGIRENYDQDSLKALQPAEQALFAWSLGRVGLTNDKVSPAVRPPWRPRRRPERPPSSTRSAPAPPPIPRALC